MGFDARRLGIYCSRPDAVPLDTVKFDSRWPWILLSVGWCDAGCGKVRFRYGPGYCFRLAGVPLGAVRLELCLVSADCGILQG